MYNKKYIEAVKKTAVKKNPKLRLVTVDFFNSYFPHY